MSLETDSNKYGSWELRLEPPYSVSGLHKHVQVWQDAISGMCVLRDPEIAHSVLVDFPDMFCCHLDVKAKLASLVEARTDLSPETLDHLWHDQIMPRAIAHDGNLVVHGGGVVIDGRAIAVMAPTGYGKSTLTASLHGVGHGLLGDDALIVETQDSAPTARAVYPSLRLLPDLIDQLYGEDAQTQMMAQYSAKRKVTVEGLNTAAPLAMMVILEPPGPEIAFRRLSIAEACMAIISNSFALDPTDRRWIVANMRYATELAKQVPVFALTYPRDFDLLPDVHALILDTLNTIGDAS